MPSSPQVLLPVALVAWATLARAETPIEISGALVGSDEAVLVRVDVRNTGERRLESLRLGGDLIGSHAEASLPEIDPGQSASGILTFPYDFDWRPGRHVLPLGVTYTLGTETSHVRAYLVLQLAVPAEPAVLVSAPEVTLDLRVRLPVCLESADGQAHRVRVRVETPRGLVAPDPPPVVDVPPHGRVFVEVPLLYGSAPRGARPGVLIVAEALAGPVERMALATTTVAIAADPAWLPMLRAPLALAALLLLGAGLVAEWRRARF